MRDTTRGMLLGLMLAMVAFVAFGLWTGSAWIRYPSIPQPGAVGTSGTIDVESAKDRGAKVGEKVGEAAAVVGGAAARARESVDEAALTSKIKAKMVLDDYVKARAIDVTTRGSVVTLSGTVGSVEEHDRAFKLARETSGVTQVVDQMVVLAR